MNLDKLRAFVDRERLRGIGLRTRVSVLVAGSVAGAVLLVAGGAWFVARQALVGGVDSQLDARATLIQREAVQNGLNGFFSFPVRTARFGFITQVIDSSGNVVLPSNADTESIPVAASDRAVAAGDPSSKGSRGYQRFSGYHLRTRTLPLGNERAVVVAQPVNAIDDALDRFALVLFILSLLGIAVAAYVGRVVARSAVRPVQRLTDAAEHVARTQELHSSIEIQRSDELGRLGAAFNAMLAALAQSRDQQQRLIHDASHELRTPLTSLRTNIEMLSRGSSIDPKERAEMLDDLNVEIRELSNIVEELVDLATATGGTDEEVQDVRLDDVAHEFAERARRRTGQEIEISAEPMTVKARPTHLERAVSNIIDNACKWNARGEPIEVSVRGGRFEVSDRGPGIDSDDLPYIFDRFYRSSAARALPGSGLGLAIVKQVIDEAGGEVFAHAREGGGAVVGFELPATPALEELQQDEALS